MLCRASAIALAIVVGACAAKTTTPLPAPSAAKFPEFIQPPVSRSLAANPAAVTSQQRGWQFLQGGDLRNAEREFKLALAVAPQFYPADTSLGYLELARKEPADALPHFEKALAAEGRDVSALVGGGLAFLALNRESDALFAFESAMAVDPSLVDIKRRVEVLRFRGLGQDLAAARQAGGRWQAGRGGARLRELRSRARPTARSCTASWRSSNGGRGNTEAALADFRKALALDPTTPVRCVAGRGSPCGERRPRRCREGVYRRTLLEPSEAVGRRLDAVRARIELARLPPEYRAIESAPQITRGDLAALIGVRLAPLVQAARRRDAIVVTDTRNHWASTWIMSVARAGIIDPYDNHTFQPRSLVRRTDLAVAMSRLLSRVAASNPAQAGPGNRRGSKFSDLSPRTPGVSGCVDGRCGGRHEDGGGQRLSADTDRQRRGSRRRDVRVDQARRRRQPGAAPGAEMTRAFTTANQMTLLRMLLIPAFVMLVIYDELGWALIVFATAGISDALDGLIARRAGQKTSLGAWLDPMADKLLLVSTFIVLTVPGLGLTNRLPIWLTALVISRDVVIVVTVAIVNLAIGRRTFRPSMFGKVATGTYIVTAVMAMLYNYRGFHSPMVDLCVYASLAITLVSGFHYIWHAARIIQP